MNSQYLTILTFAGGYDTLISVNCRIIYNAIQSYVSIYEIWNGHNLPYSHSCNAYLIYKLIMSEKIILPSRIVSSKSPEDILNERYAKGELTREQYVQIKEDIKKPT
jgi:putative membrane protein